MGQSWKENHALYLIVVGAMAWLVPGAGHYLLNEKRRAAVILVAVLLTFLAGMYVGSIGVIDPVNAKPWYAAQVMNSPAVLLLGNHVATAYHTAQAEARSQARMGRSGGQTMTQAYLVFGRAGEIGQIYTSVAGLLNLLCIVNAIYVAHQRSVEGAQT
ncbi:MAG: DUF6677 family protein [Phycisphaerales bacterium]